MRCPVCQTPLRIVLEEQSPDEFGAERRDAWREVEHDAQLREAQRGDQQDEAGW